MDNKLTVWYNADHFDLDGIDTFVKKEIEERYGFAEGEFEDIENGFKFLYDDETGGEIAITFIEQNNTLKVSVEGTWAWETIEIYDNCLPPDHEV